MSGQYEDHELVFIRENYQEMSDKQISEKLDRPLTGIVQQRKKMGLTKSNGRPKKATEPKKPKDIKAHISNLSDMDKVEYVKLNLKASPRMKFLNKNLDKEEMDYYIAQWVRYHEDLESLKTTEEESLHAMIMEEITVMRLENDMKKSRDGDGPIKLNLYKELNDAKRRFKEFQQSLSASREQRLKMDGSDSINIVKIIQAMQKKEVRKKIGEDAGIYDYIKGLETQRLKDGGFLEGDF